jgi:tagatose-6-phosphate ketose/aldose isomerase
MPHTPHTDERQPGPSLDQWLSRLARHGEIGALLESSWDEQLDRGYGHTLREICQQPVTWLETADRVVAHVPLVEKALEAAGARDGTGALILTGSGSSVYAGECLALGLQESLHVPVAAVAAGQLLTHPGGSIPPAGPFGVVSFGRSGNSPESRGVVDALLAAEPRATHLVITCNGAGKLATEYRSVPGVRTLVLDEKTNDESLVMTSSFTNMVLAAKLLAWTGDTAGYASRARRLAQEAAQLLLENADAIAGTARSAYHSAVYLGSGCRFGAAREAALKMLEMNGGRIPTFPESYLGLRHGPMSAVHDDTLVVAFLSSEPVVRAYEADLIRELDRKKLGARRVVVGAGVPADLAAGADDVIVDCGDGLADEDLVVIDVVVGQLLAFFRCLGAGLRPDSPSADGVISRVVSAFAIHRRV